MTDELNKILEKLYNTAWVEGNLYTDELEQKGIDTEVRSKRELQACKRTTEAIQAIIDRSVAEARIDELKQALLAESDRPDADFASQMLAVCTHVKERLATLTEQGDDDINVTISPEQGEKK